MSEFNRRDLLKYFGVGAVISPLAIGSGAVAARLIEVPKVELVKPAGIEIPLDPARVKQVTVICHYEDGTRWARSAPAQGRGFVNLPVTDISLNINLARGGSPSSTVAQIWAELPL